MARGRKKAENITLEEQLEAVVTYYVGKSNFKQATNTNFG